MPGFHSLNWCFSVGHAEKIDCPNSSVQLITAAQACHWFDLPKFYAEAQRVLVPGGFLALYGYHLPRPKYGNTHEELCNIIEKVLLQFFRSLSNVFTPCLLGVCIIYQFFLSVLLHNTWPLCVTRK
jgi:ubiquinone/menaquinone biosynthesis C-methylase UbiE